MPKLSVKVQLLDPRAEMPVKAHESDSGYDLKIIDVKEIVGDVIFFRTGVAVQPPKGHYFEMVPRSSISKLPLVLANSVGIVDEDYTGELLIALRVMHGNSGTNIRNMTFPGGLVDILGAKPQSMLALANVLISKKPKVCQLLLKKRVSADFVEVEALEETERAAGGFGSTDEEYANTDE